jgi:hypothetical protein
MRTHLCPDGFGQLAEILRGCLGLVDMRRMAVDLRMRWVWAAMVRRDARGGRRLLVRHGHVLRARVCEVSCAPCEHQRGSDGRQRDRQAEGQCSIAATRSISKNIFRQSGN